VNYSGRLQRERSHETKWRDKPHKRRAEQTWSRQTSIAILSWKNKTSTRKTQRSKVTGW